MDETNMGKLQEVRGLADKAIRYVKAELTKEYPYLGAAFHLLVPVYDTEEKQMCTDGIHLFCNPEYIFQCFTKKKKQYQKLKYLYLHIVLHCLLGHVDNKQAEMGNLYDWCADFYVDRVMRNLVGKRRQMSWADYEDYEQLERLAGTHTVLGMMRIGKKRKDVLETLERMSGKLYGDTHEYWTKQHPGTGKNSMEKLWKTICYQSEQFQNLLGSSGKNQKYGRFWGEEEWQAEAEPDNLSDYKELLRRLCSIEEIPQQEEVEYDYSLYRTGILLYGNKPILEAAEYVEKETASHLVIALDTSGSCVEWSGKFLRETMNILQDMNLGRERCGILVLECDARIQQEMFIRDLQDIRQMESSALYGGGGTDFTPVFECIRQKQESGEIERVAGLIYLSDGMGSFPEEPPDYETIFLLPDDGGMSGFQGESEEEGAYLPGWVTRMVLTEKDIEDAEQEVGI